MECKDNILTYLKFRGDLDINKYPFNEVDALILCEMAYIRFDGIVPLMGDNGEITIAEAAKKYVKSTGKDVAFYKNFEILLDAIAKSPRFADMTLCNYISTTDLKERQQFGAIHINISPFLTFIAFRGTDETIVGWREDCNMTYMMPVPAQISAVNYVNQTANGMFKKYWIGGHSKGGNLAIYSSVFCDPKIQKKIIKINSFDGPGFNRKVIGEEAYIRVKDRISAFVPESSVVGMLMEHEEEYKVVKSNEVAFMQHNGFSWEIDSTKFVTMESTDEFSNSISTIIRSWLSKIEPEERKIFVDAVFDVFEAGGITEIYDFNNIDVHKAKALIKAAASLPPKYREVVGKLIKLLIEETHNV